MMSETHRTRDESHGENCGWDDPGDDSYWWNAFVPGRGATDVIFIIWQLQEKFLSRKDLNDKNLTLFFAIVDLEKAFDHVPQKVLWWAMRKVGVEEWIVRLVQAMYNNAWASYQICKIVCCACAGNAGNVFPHRRLQRKPLVSDPDIHHGTCVTHVPWCMSGSLTRGGGENVPGIPGACATQNFTYLARGPCSRVRVE